MEILSVVEIVRRLVKHVSTFLMASGMSVINLNVEEEIILTG